ncbi:MAG: FAD-dependent oxidoreductase, partial [Candidatus Limivicinus sp.]
MTADVVVIGAGASGLMAALTAAEQGASVLLVEKNRKAGRKLRITGKGRCNLTNDCEVREVLAQIPGDGRFLYSSLTAFPPQAVMRFFRENGLELKTERGRRVFPCSDNANDVADLLMSLCQREGVRFLWERAADILVEDGAVQGVWVGKRCIRAPSCVV